MILYANCVTPVKRVDERQVREVCRLRRRDHRGAVLEGAVAPRRGSRDVFARAPDPDASPTLPRSRRYGKRSAGPRSAEEAYLRLDPPCRPSTRGLNPQFERSSDLNE